jgi:hypothetical protein
MHGTYNIKKSIIIELVKFIAKHCNKFLFYLLQAVANYLYPLLATFSPSWLLDYSASLKIVEIISFFWTFPISSKVKVCNINSSFK